MILSRPSVYDFEFIIVLVVEDLDLPIKLLEPDILCHCALDRVNPIRAVQASATVLRDFVRVCVMNQNKHVHVAHLREFDSFLEEIALPLALQISPALAILDQLLGFTLGIKRSR